MNSTVQWFQKTRSSLNETAPRNQSESHRESFLGFRWWEQQGRRKPQLTSSAQPLAPITALSCHWRSVVNWALVLLLVGAFFLELAAILAITVAAVCSLFIQVTGILLIRGTDLSILSLRRRDELIFKSVLSSFRVSKVIPWWMLWIPFASVVVRRSNDLAGWGTPVCIHSWVSTGPWSLMTSLHHHYSCCQSQYRQLPHWDFHCHWRSHHHACHLAQFLLHWWVVLLPASATPSSDDEEGSLLGSSCSGSGCGTATTAWLVSMGNNASLKKPHPSLFNRLFQQWLSSTPQLAGREVLARMPLHLIWSNVWVFSTNPEIHAGVRQETLIKLIFVNMRCQDSHLGLLSDNF